jgi:transposase
MGHSLLVSDGLWAVLEPLLPERPAWRVGRPRVDDRVAFNAILFVLHGVPLGVELTGGNRNDVTQLLPLVDGIGAIAGKRGRPRQRPDQVIADRGYDHDKYRHNCGVAASSR